MLTRTPDNLLSKLTAEIVSAYVSNNALNPGDLFDLIDNVRGSLELLGTQLINEIAFHAPAVPINRSLQANYLVCLEDGKKFKSLRRHLATHHHMSPEQYRQKWQLPSTYPMVAPAFSDARSALAKKHGLGRTHKSRR